MNSQKRSFQQDFPNWLETKADFQILGIYYRELFNKNAENLNISQFIMDLVKQSEP